MKALIFNSGTGCRMGILISEYPKCMTKIFPNETILSRQLKQIADSEIEEIIIITKPFDNVLVNYCQNIGLSRHITFVNNPVYKYNGEFKNYFKFMK